jgi:hypothetical protein
MIAYTRGLAQDTLTQELAMLRSKAASIVGELAELYRRMDELERQIAAHLHRPRV